MNDQVKDEHSFRHQLLSWQSGSAVTRIQPGIVRKKGHKVRPPEEKALRLVKQYAPQVPIPSIHAASYRFENGLPVYGKLDMDFMPGRTLKSAWAELDEGVKDRVCRDIWDLIAAIRESVPRPADLAPGRYRTVDGSPSLDHLLGDSTDVAPPELNEDTIRDRICVSVYCPRGALVRRGQRRPRHASSLPDVGLYPRQYRTPESHRRRGLPHQRCSWLGVLWLVP